MKHYRVIGLVAGAIFGAVASGVCIYFTQSPFSSLVALACTFLGAYIGKAMEQKK